LLGPLVSFQLSFRGFLIDYSVLIDLEAEVHRVQIALKWT
jgi:hypothetical protein